jgi:hypothetical protein
VLGFNLLGDALRDALDPKQHYRKVNVAKEPPAARDPVAMVEAREKQA